MLILYVFKGGLVSIDYEEFTFHKITKGYSCLKLIKELGTILNISVDKEKLISARQYAIDCYKDKTYNYQNTIVTFFDSLNPEIFIILDFLSGNSFNLILRIPILIEAYIFSVLEPVLNTFNVLDEFNNKTHYLMFKTSNYKNNFYFYKEKFIYISLPRKGKEHIIYTNEVLLENLSHSI